MSNQFSFSSACWILCHARPLRLVPSPATTSFDQKRFVPEEFLTISSEEGKPEEIILKDAGRLGVGAPQCGFGKALRCYFMMSGFESSWKGAHSWVEGPSFRAFEQKMDADVDWCGPLWAATQHKKNEFFLTLENGIKNDLITINKYIKYLSIITRTWPIITASWIFGHNQHRSTIFLYSAWDWIQFFWVVMVQTSAEFHTRIDIGLGISQ